MIELAAGSLTASLRDGRLAAVTINGHPALDAVQVAVRDDRWRTVPARVESVFETTPNPTGASDPTIRMWQLTVRHQLDSIDVEWTGRLTVAPERIEFQILATALSEFRANRIGLCLLHPQALRGRPVVLHGVGGVRTGRFAPEIAPYQPFQDIRGMSYPVSNGGDRLEIRLDGEIFETEDHRNWSDPGWKTYCPPLSRPTPTHFRPGDTIAQSIVLTSQPSSSSPRRSPVHDHVLAIGPSNGRTGAPDLGALASLRPDTVDRVGAAWPGGHPWKYLVVELVHRPGGRPEDVDIRLARAAAEARGLAVPLDVWITTTPAELEMVVDRIIILAGGVLGRVGVFDPEIHVATAELVARARELLPVGTVLVGGTRAHFAELNRNPNSTAGADWVGYSLTPQVHHSADEDVLATAPAVGDACRQALSGSSGRPVIVGPVTLTPRFNATDGAATLADPLEPLAGEGDRRQHSALATAYVCSALSQLAHTGAITVFATDGPAGVIGADGRPDATGRLLTAMTELAGGSSLTVSGAGDLGVLAVLVGSSTVVVAGNASDTEAVVQFSGHAVERHEHLTDLMAGRCDPEAPLESGARIVLGPRSVHRFVLADGENR